jgi:putative serine protease PepD
VIGVLLDLDYAGPGARVQDESATGDPVTAGGPAERAGVEPGDVIVAFDGRAVADSDDLIVAIRAKDVGDRVHVSLRRDGKLVDVTMTLQAAPAK